MNLISQGAEAKIFEHEGAIHKQRISKSYRNKILDEQIRKSRTNREAKILKKLEDLNFPSPKLLRKEDYTLIMELIEGPQLKEVFSLDHCKEIGKLLSQMHEHDLIHGDLTTSNMILKENQIYFIDFGLSQVSKKVEDRAVDLHLLKHAIDSKHWQNSQKAFELVLEGYDPSTDILERLEIVELRGKNKGKGD